MRFVATSGDQVLSFPVRQGSTILGRHSTCHIRIPSRGVSRRHCQVYVDGGSVVLRDLGSSLGTFVNGQRVERAELRDGDVVTLGNIALRFELGDGPAGGGFAHAAAPAQDIVVTAEPAGPTEPTRGLAAGGAPAPTDFPEPPEGDETPADAGFVPPTYTGTLLPSAQLQPVMVIRDGRWFLRDPRTGREVEITPKDAAAVPAPRPEAAEARRPNVRLLIAAIAAAAIVVFGFAFFFLSQKPVEPTGGPALSKEEYKALVDTAIRDVRARKYEPAFATLDRAASERPDLQVARHLRQYAEILKTAGDNFDKFDWKEGRRYLMSVKDTGSASDAAIAFAQEELNRIHREQTLLGEAQAMEDKLREGGDSEEVLVEVYKFFIGLPKESYAARKYAPKAAELKGRLAGRHLARARAAAGERKWDEAVKSFEAACEFAADPAPIKKQIADCRRFGQDALNFDEARKEVAAKQFAFARGHLKLIREDSPYTGQAKALLAQIDAAERDRASAELRQQILNLYERGSGHEAVKLAEENHIEDFKYMKDRVTRWEQLMAEGQRAEDEKKYEDALKTYQLASEVETDAKNEYRRRAEQRLQALKGRSNDIAAEIADQGWALVDTDPVGARRAFTRAQWFQADQPKAKAGLDQLQRNASGSYTRAMVLVHDKRYAEGRRVLDRAKDCAEPGGVLYNKIVQALRETPKE